MNKIRVLIEANQNITFRRIVEIERSEWDDMKRIPLSEMENESTSPLSKLLFDPRYIYFRDDFENVEMIAVDEHEKFVDPRDYYEGGE